MGGWVGELVSDPHQIMHDRFKFSRNPLCGPRRTGVSLETVGLRWLVGAPACTGTLVLSGLQGLPTLATARCGNGARGQVPVTTYPSSTR